MNGYTPFTVQPLQPSFDFGFQPSSIDPTLLAQTNQAITNFQPATTTPSGWNWGNIGTAIQGIGALTGGYAALQNLGLAKENLAFQKEAFNKNYATQRQLTNQQLLDRQRARYAANPNAYASPDVEWQGQNLIR